MASSRPEYPFVSSVEGDLAARDSVDAMADAHVGCRNPYHCIVPPYLVERLAQSPNKEVRSSAISPVSSASSRLAAASRLASSASRCPPGSSHR